MKKLLNLLILISIIICSNNIVYATNKSYDIKLVTSSTTVKAGDEIKVTLKILNFEGFQEGIYAFLANVECNNIFETIQEEDFTPKERWSIPTYNSNTNQIVSDTSNGVKNDSDIFELKLKVKQGLQPGTKGSITIKNFVASEGDIDIQANQETKIEFVIADNNQGNQNNGGTTDNNQGNQNNGGTTDNNQENQNNGGTTNNNQENLNSENEKNNNKKSESNGTNLNNESQKVTNSSTGKIPQTGENEIIILIIALVTVIFGIISYIKYKKSY